MAKTKIVNEIPDELEMEGEEVEVKTTEAEKAASEEQTGDVEIPKEEAKKEAKPVQEELEFDIEIEDDTPKADRNREPLPENVKQELEADNLEEYSERVKNRMAQLKKAWHDERREKEASLRREKEAERIAALQMQENKKLLEQTNADLKKAHEEIQRLQQEKIDVMKENEHTVTIVERVNVFESVHHPRPEYEIIQRLQQLGFPEHTLRSLNGVEGIQRTLFGTLFEFKRMESYQVILEV